MEKGKIATEADFLTFYFPCSLHESSFTRQGVCIPELKGKAGHGKLLLVNITDGLDPAKDRKIWDGVNESIRYLVL